MHPIVEHCLKCGQGKFRDLSAQYIACRSCGAIHVWNGSEWKIVRYTHRSPRRR